MRRLLVVLLAVSCKPGISEHRQLCAKAAAMFEKCETIVAANRLEHDLVVDRWRGLCRAVFTGETDQLLPDGLALYYSMDEGTKLGLQKQAECSARATNCTEYAACEQ